MIPAGKGQAAMRAGIFDYAGHTFVQGRIFFTKTGERKVLKCKGGMTKRKIYGIILVSNTGRGKGETKE